MCIKNSLFLDQKLIVAPGEVMQGEGCLCKFETSKRKSEMGCVQKIEVSEEHVKSLISSDGIFSRSLAQ